MKKSRLAVDFNEMITKDEILLSQADSKVSEDGEVIVFVEGMQVMVYEEDKNDKGERDDLIAEGTVLRNHHGGWTKLARWLLKINQDGIRHQSDID